MRVDDFDYHLPQDRIAEQPAEPRDAARLMVLDRRSGSFAHRRIADLPELLDAGDLLVVNDTEVMPWRLRGVRPTGGRIDVLITARDGELCHGLVKPARKLAAGSEASLEGGRLQLRVVEALGGGRLVFRLLATGGGDLDAVLDAVGRAPLPPYLPRDGSEDVIADRRAYQTVFAAVPGAVAAPTAGLHFTAELLDRLAARGVARAAVTLHVGEGTFAPVRVERVEAHRMHAERFDLPVATAEAVARVRARGGRVVAVGTTVTRTLEACAAGAGCVRAGRGETALFLVPGCEFRVVDALLTNFHLPRSTLLMLVAAFAGRDRVLAAYAAAVDAGYRFYSFGDAMLIR